jgi:hypothetical protein
VLSPVPCKLEVDGRVQPPEAWSLVVASVVRNVGIHMLVTYRAAEEMDRFHCVASALPPKQLGPQMPRVLAGKRLRGVDHVDELAREVHLRFHADGAYVLDGEVLRAREVAVTAGPTIRVVEA